MHVKGRECVHRHNPLETIDPLRYKHFTQISSLPVIWRWCSGSIVCISNVLHHRKDIMVSFCFTTCSLEKKPSKIKSWIYIHIFYRLYHILPFIKTVLPISTHFLKWVYKKVRTFPPVAYWILFSLQNLSNEYFSMGLRLSFSVQKALLNEFLPAFDQHPPELHTIGLLLSCLTNWKHKEVIQLNETTTDYEKNYKSEIFHTKKHTAHASTNWWC